MTVEELYEAFMDIYPTPELGLNTDPESGLITSDPRGPYVGPDEPWEPKSFAQDIFDFLDMGTRDWTSDLWIKDYGMYLPTFDPTGIELAGRERDIDFEKALDTLDITRKATDRIYKTELDTLSTGLGREMQKGRAVSGGLGLRSGSLETAVEDTMQQAGTRTKELGDRVMLSEEEMLDKYNIAMVDTTLDFDKTERQEKEDFYDRTMAAIMRLQDVGGLEKGPCECGPQIDWEWYNECVESGGSTYECKYNENYGAITDVCTNKDTGDLC